ncbi:TIGR04086 family membrane protein [Clostridium sp. 19966]|uniref:TIGR04086 family membrane protein n=1 Tax=Clostridium sp. 19966 TaxID=2768166 RepID=UPI0028DD8F01|nr:TIGR04086 family membrane protein [Clostridium sp. 19966]MDT8717470.1 TIGR04086 family membrane protein [Clostridium sp. 19966]
MEGKKVAARVTNGVLRASMFTVIMIIILAVIMNFTDVGNSFLSVYFVIVTCISVLYGAIYAARKNNKNGWLIGILVAFFYMMVLYIISAVMFNEPSIESKDIMRFVIALMVGALSGMLGINI